jgi:tRNA1(Val) A37 N6-methylase TrmN6
MSDSTPEQDVIRKLWRLGDAQRSQPLHVLRILSEVLIAWWFVSKYVGLASKKTSSQSSLFPNLSSWRDAKDKISRLGGAHARNALREIFEEVARVENKIAPLLENPAFQDASPQQLRVAFDFVSELGRENEQEEDLLAPKFDKVIETSFSRTKYRGLYYTSSSVSTLVSSLVNPKPGDSVLDPCFGTGGLTASLVSKTQPGQNKKRTSELDVTGIEIDAELYPIALARMLLTGNRIPNFSIRNAFSDDSIEDKYDIVVADPPFGTKAEIPHASRIQVPVPTDSAELLFLQATMKALKPGGRAAILLPDGVLFREGRYQKVREYLLEKFAVDAVLSLGRKQQGDSSVRRNILCFSRTKPTENVWFVSEDLATQAIDTDSGQTQSIQSTIQDVLGKAVSIRRGDTSPKNLRDLWKTSVDSLRESARDRLGERSDDSNDSTDVDFDVLRQFLRSGTSKQSDGHQTEALYLTVSSIARSFGEENAREIVDDPSSIQNIPLYAWRTPVHLLEERNYELVVKQTGEEELEALLADIETAQEISQRVEVVPLDDVARCFGGVQYRSDYLDESAPPFTEVKYDRPPFIRIRDLEDGTITDPQTEITHLETVKEYHRLRRGDVVISTKGTVGKVAIVPEAMEGAVPASGLVVIRPSSAYNSTLFANYLRALLDTAPYQQWLEGHSSGSAALNLRIDTLSRLPIIVGLPRGIQNRIARKLEPGDSAADLQALIRPVEVPKIVQFLERGKAVSKFLETEAEEPVGRSISAARALLTEFRDRLNDSDLKSSDNLLLEETSLLAKVLDVFVDGIENFEGPSRLVMLNEVGIQARKLIRESAEQSLSSKSSDHQKETREQLAFDRARSRTLEIAEQLDVLAEAERRRMLNDIDLSIDLSPASVKANQSSKAILYVANQGALPLRHFRIEIQSTQFVSTIDKGSSDLPSEKSFEITIEKREIPLKPESREEEFSLHVPEIPPGHYELHLNCQAQRTDGSPFQDTISVPLDVLEPGEFEGRGDDIGASPYVVGDPVEPDMFFGRSKVLKKIRQQLGPGGSGNIILLEGNRRIGKSSIFRQLEEEDWLPGWIVVSCSFQKSTGDESRTGIPTREVFFSMARETGVKLHKDSHDVRIPGQGRVEVENPLNFRRRFREQLEDYFDDDDRSFERFLDLFERWMEEIGDQSLLLLLDEFDKLDEGIESGVTSPQVPENLRSLFQENQRLSAILAGGRRIRKLREDYWSVLFGIGRRISLSPLETEEAKRLIIEPVRGRLTYDRRAATHLAKLCANHPFLVQTLSDQVFSYCWEKDMSTVTVDIVEVAAQEMIEDNEHFQTLWDYIPNVRIQFLLLLIHELQSGGDPTNLDVLHMRLEEEGILISETESLKKDYLDPLRELGLVQMESSNVPGTKSKIYEPGIPLMGRWIEQHQDRTDLRSRAQA